MYRKLYFKGTQLDTLLEYDNNNKTGRTRTRIACTKKIRVIINRLAGQLIAAKADSDYLDYLKSHQTSLLLIILLPLLLLLLLLFVRVVDC